MFLFNHCCLCVHCGENRWLATSKRWRFVRGHDKPIHESCTIYFLGISRWYIYIYIFTYWKYWIMSKPRNKWVDSCHYIYIYIFVCFSRCSLCIQHHNWLLLCFRGTQCICMFKDIYRHMAYGFKHAYHDKNKPGLMSTAPRILDSSTSWIIKLRCFLACWCWML